MLVIGSVLIAGCMETEEQKKAMEGGESGKDDSGGDTCKIDEPCGENETGVKKKIAVIETNKGTIKFELYTEKAPKTTENFINLANDGFYQGLIFHRVVSGFVIQGGGFYPDGTQKESPYGTIDLEIHPDLVHDGGAVAMARTSDPNSATSQFYICDGPQHDLDDAAMQQYGMMGYAVFGKVIEGMDVVKSIASVETTTKQGMSDWPAEDVIIKKVTIKEE